MAHVHHHVARNPVIAEWHANNNLQQTSDNLVATVTHVVYITQTGSEPVSTDSPSVTSTRTTTFQLSPGPSATSSSQTGYNAPSRQVRPSSSSSDDSSTSGTSQTTLVSSPMPTTLLVASTSGAIFSSTGIAAAASTSLTATPQSSNGMSGGAKAGLAFGVIIVIALMVAAIIFFVRRKKQADAEQHHRIDDEKNEMRQKSQSISSHVSVRRTKTNAPRLSLRPVTQMFMLGSEKQAAATDAATGTVTPEPLSHEPPMSHDSTNPFGDHAAEKDTITAPAAAAQSSAASDRTLSNLSDRSPPMESQAFPTAVAGSRRNSPPGPGPNNVHRVQLDFKPSMDDELELRAGSLVRMLHEYDDGWALCIRLDRSQQGVVPRTCISKLPVKPRPGPPPPSMRGPPPQSRPRANSNAAGPRMPPNGPPRGPPASGRMRSQSNAPHQDQRSQSPALRQYPQHGRPRSNSDATAGSGTPSPTGSVSSRKPVPGQAM